MTDNIVGTDGHDQEVMEMMSLGQLREWLDGKVAAGVKQVRVQSVVERLPNDTICPTCSADILDADVTLLQERLGPQLVGTAEAAALLGIERPRIGRWRKLGLMPEPITDLAAGPIWLRSQIEALREGTERRRKTRRTPEDVAAA